MQMTMRWFGSKHDSVKLDQIRQVPGVKGVITTLYDTAPGEAWKTEDIKALKAEVEAHGLKISGIESVNIHDAIKIGTPDREEYIENYITTLERLGQEGIRMVCYNFMPVFDWTRTELFHPNEDGSTSMYYEKDKIMADPKEMAEYITEKCKGFTMPGWEPERMAHLSELFDAYKDVTKEKLWANLEYFLNALMPTCRETDIKLAIHQDDPPWDIFGLPRLLVDEPSIDRFLKMVDDPYNCLTLCSGSVSSNPANNTAAIVRKHCDRIAFAHIRNVKHYPNGDFKEVSHRDCDGDTGVLDIVKAYHDMGFNGYVRPDHGRHIWGEKCRPGYGLYDRALGIMYLLGAFDMLDKVDGK